MLAKVEGNADLEMQVTKTLEAEDAADACTQSD